MPDGIRYALWRKKELYHIDFAAAKIPTKTALEKYSEAVLQFSLHSLLTNAICGAKLKVIFEKEVRQMSVMFWSWNMPMSVYGDAHRAGLTLSYPKI